MICVGSLCLAGKSLANPLGEQISSGSATFLREGGNLFIRQGSEKLIIDWREFSIRAGELTEFLQPGSDAAALNRVFSGNPSEIYGSLRANGKVYLINPNGIFIGPSGRVDTGSFAASTLEISDAEFLQGGSLTFKGTSEASVVNFGTINALDGDAFLIAKTVENYGTINAPKGTAGLAGGTEVILQPAGDEKIGVSIASGAGKVVNAGKIAAAQAELKAAGGNLYALAIQNSGTVRATGVERRDGRVFLRARSGTIENTGQIQAKNANGSGGRVAIGPEINADGSPGSIAGVRVVNSGVVDVSGSTGGSVTISAEDVSLSASSQLIADGEFGGGTISAVAENSMEFRGSILARATAEDARGGSAEVSGRTFLAFDGVADLRGFGGNAGTLTLDPTNFTIDGGAAAAIVSNLSTSNVVIATSSAGTGAGDIFVNAPVLYTSANSLSLLAHRNIEANASIQNSGAGALNLVAGWDGATGAGAANLDFALFTGTPSSYGNNGGSILIGSGAQSSAIAVGSRFGATNAAGFGMTITGSGGNNTASAQFGFRPAEGVATDIAGPIQVELKGDLTLRGGEANFSFAQIGHGGRLSTGNIQGAISINVAGDLRMTGGVNFSYTQIGHGGDRVAGALAGSISIRSNDLSILGGTKPNAFALVGHGDGSNDSAGSRTGAIDILASGDTNLVNGPATNAVWEIGHRTTTPSAISAADVAFSVGTLDYSLTAPATQTTLSQDFVDKFSRDLLGGNVTIQGGGSGGLVIDGGFNYNSSRRLTLLSDGSATVKTSITNGGSGEIHLVIDAENPNRPNLNPAATLTIAPTANVSSGGAVRIFTVSPANTHLGGYTPAGQRYNVWFGDAVTVAGVNFKVHPILTLTANNQTKVYGEMLIFAGDEFTTTGLQPGDVLSQILVGDVGLSSLGSIATAGVTGSPYVIGFNPNLTVVSGYELQVMTGTLTVTPATLSLTALSQSKGYGSTFTFAGTEFSSVGIKNGESVGAVDLASAGSAATAEVSGSPYAITVGNARGGTFNPANYAIGYNAGALTVTPASLTITANNRSKVYGNVLSFAGTEFTSAGLRNSDTVSSVSLSSAGALATAGVAGSPFVIAASNALGSGLGNYTIAYAPGALTVTPATLSLTALNQSKVYGNAFTFTGTEFSAVGIKNGERVGLVDMASDGSAATAGVAGGPYAITIDNAHGGTFNPANYTISYFAGDLSVTPAQLVITARDQRKRVRTDLDLDGTLFKVRGLQNGETIDLVALTSNGAVASARRGTYAIHAADAGGGTYDPANYSVRYVDGTLTVFGPTPPLPPADQPPVTRPPLTQEQLQQLLAQNDPNNLSPESGGDSRTDEASVISAYGIQRLNVNSFFGEQLVEPGGAIIIDSTGLGPLLPMSEGPQTLENDLEEKRHDALEAAIAEDDKKRKVGGKSHTYEVSPTEVLTADEPGDVSFSQLREGPPALQRAVNANTEERLHRAIGL